MVWAATKLIIWDDLYPTYRRVNIEYKGRNPETVYRYIKRLLLEVFRVPEGNFQEKNFKWETSEKGNEFKVEWDAIKPLDNFTYLKIEVRLKGFSSGGVGRISLSYRPTIVTEYPQDTFWQQNILYEMLRRLWHVLFYRRKRNEYFEMGLKMAHVFEERLKEYIRALS
ncbi:MAG: hypothetical protein J7L43_01750 [Candidatus Aenigmarchaeota archaeon]|nr:hypothetical protein [Candidatus Aenigmarchaeota archaeon]